MLEDFPERVRRWSEDEDTKEFFKDVADTKERWVEALRGAGSIEAVYRAQGALDALDGVLDVVKVARRVQEDLKAGKRR